MDSLSRAASSPGKDARSPVDARSAVRGNVVAEEVARDVSTCLYEESGLVLGNALLVNCDLDEWEIANTLIEK